MGALQEFKSHELYEKFMRGVNEGLNEYRKLFPLDKVELIEDGDSLFVTVNGKKTNEIEFDFILKGKSGSA